ncbi:hypothetical protein [Streptomyces sp. R33]|uniref:Uncharacterized protein n=1 Tax=Streptomyces sp. R33 TaxID=3238629 RepID=A0AB39XUU4_9ACTN
MRVTNTPRRTPAENAAAKAFVLAAQATVIKWYLHDHASVAQLARAYKVNPDWLPDTLELWDVALRDRSPPGGSE